MNGDAIFPRAIEDWFRSWLAYYLCVTALRAVAACVVGSYVFAKTGCQGIYVGRRLSVSVRGVVDL